MNTKPIFFLLTSLILPALTSCQALSDQLTAGRVMRSQPYAQPYAQPANRSAMRASGSSLASASGGHMSTAARVPSPTVPLQATPAAVQVNGRQLTAQQLAAIQARYGLVPTAGQYWYDALTGFYGLLGGPALGVMNTDHDFGPMPATASSGHSGVIVNGRNLSSAEVLYLQAIIGSAIMPQRYWMDAAGNVGYEGSRVAIGNLYALAGQRQGQWNGGDNFWSSNYGAGNSNADNSAGYVSVPGHGPIGYGR